MVTFNSRVAKVDKDGNWLKSWGEPGSGPGQLNTPHSIAADAQGNIYVADRGNGRIQVFDGEGKLLRIITINVPVPSDARPAIGNKPGPDVTGTMAPGAPWAVCITPGPTQYLYAADAYPGRIYKTESRWQGPWLARQVRQTAEAIRLDSRNRLPIRERIICRRIIELAGAETDT